MRKLEARKKKEKEREQAEKEAAEKLKEKLASITVEIAAKAGEGGRLFGSITSKQIAEELKKKHNMNIDRRKIDLKEPLRSLGHHQVEVKLHPEVSGTIRVHVVEQ